MPTTIMIVDDAEIVRKLVRVALKGAVDTDFLEAQDATEALKIAREHRGMIHLLLSDVVMPGRIGGIELAARLCHAHPETKVLLMSGYAPDVLTIKPEWNFVQKPFAASEIREIVRSILDEDSLAA
jgi:two-component system, cell cycle sensor histidine kinase and response regulator CckA